MTRAARLGRILTLLRASPSGVSRATLMQRLGVSRAALYRDIAVLRDELRHPIVPTANGWRIQKDADPAFVRDEIPGVFLSARECYALLTLYNVLRSLDPGFLDEYVRPLHGVLKRIMVHRNLSSAGLSRKVAVRLGTFERAAPSVFTEVVNALMQEKRLKLRYTAPAGAPIEREVSPQRIVLRSVGWFLDALIEPEKHRVQIALPSIQKARALSRQATTEQLPPESSLGPAPSS